MELDKVVNSHDKVVYGQGDFEKDMKDVINLCGTWWNDSLFYKLYGVDYKVDDSFFRMLKSFGLIYTCGRIGDELVSCYVGIKCPYMFNPSVQTAQEIVWCIKYEYRSYKVLIGLIRSIDELITKNDIKLWNLNVSNEEKYNSTGKFLERNGYKLMDKTYSNYKGEYHG